MKTSLKRTLSVFGLVCLLAAGAYALVRTPFAGWSAAETRPGARMLSPAGNGEVTFTFDPDDTAMTQPQPGEPVAAVSFDGDLRDLPQTGPEEKTLGVEFKPAGFDWADPDFIDPVLQGLAGPSSVPDPSASFAGLDLSTWGAGWPPDTNGDIGPNHYIQTVNTSIGIYNRAGTQLQAITFNNFFPNDGALAACGAGNRGDPVVLFDDVSGRWIITDFAWTDIQDGPYYECIAVSKTSNPVSGGWWFYALDAFDSEAGAWLNDYPKLGVWHDGIYMTANMFDCLNATCTQASYKGVKIWTLNRADLINGQPLNYQYANLGSAYFSLLPAHARGSAIPPAGTPNYLGAVHWDNSNVIRTWKLSINWNNPNNSSITGPLNTTVSAYTHPFTVPQLGGPNVDALGGRLMAQLQYTRVNGTPALWVTHSVVTSGRTGLRWYEFRNLGGTPSVFQQGTYSPDTTHRWMGAVGVDRFGNMAVVYSVSSSSLHPGIRYAGRLVGDPLGTLGQSEATLVNGNGSQTAGGFGRWGDYAGMALDPLDECTFWFTTEYYNVTGTNWQTRIGSFTYPQCSFPPGLDIDTFLPVIIRD